MCNCIFEIIRSLLKLKASATAVHCVKEGGGGVCLLTEILTPSTLMSHFKSEELGRHIRI